MKLTIRYCPTWFHNLTNEHDPLETISSVQLATDDLIQTLSQNKLSNYRQHRGLHCGEIYGEIIILRILRRIREGLITPEQVEFLHLSEAASEGREDPLILPITPDGDFSLPFPGGFFSWRASELF